MFIRTILIYSPYNFYLTIMNYQKSQIRKFIYSNEHLKCFFDIALYCSFNNDEDLLLDVLISSFKGKNTPCDHYNIYKFLCLFNSPYTLLSISENKEYYYNKLINLNIDLFSDLAPSREFLKAFLFNRITDDKNLVIFNPFYYNIDGSGFKDMNFDHWIKYCYSQHRFINGVCMNKNILEGTDIRYSNSIFYVKSKKDKDLLQNKADPMVLNIKVDG